jgi:hypothetical protein
MPAIGASTTGVATWWGPIVRPVSGRGAVTSVVVTAISS